MSKHKTFTTKNDLPVEVREKAVALLNQQLADTFDLYSQIKQAHWNVKGMHFIQLHLLFDTLAGEVLEHVDLIAERATSLGGIALGTARLAAASSRLTEFPIEGVNGRHAVEALSARYAALAKTTRAGIDTAAQFGDADTADVFTEVSRNLDLRLWFLEAHVQE